MSELANVKARVVEPAALGTSYWLPALLGCNTLLLWALDGAEAIPEWLKMAATLFLRF
jgi:hypothetical protein